VPFGVEASLLAIALKVYLGPYQPVDVPPAGPALSSWLRERLDTVRVSRRVLEWAITYLSTIPERDDRRPGQKTTADVAKAKRLVELFGFENATAARLVAGGVEDLEVVKDARGESKVRRVSKQAVMERELERETRARSIERQLSRKGRKPRRRRRSAQGKQRTKRASKAAKK
jgi:hypothetical protein